MNVVSIVCLALGLSAAQARTMEEKLQAACRADIQALCPDHAPDDTKACMLQKRARVSAACLKWLDAAE